MKSILKASGTGAPSLPPGMLVGRNSKRSVLFGQSRMAIACLAVYAVMVLTPAATLADRGQGSIRAAARPAPAPPPRASIHVEAPHAPPDVRPAVPPNVPVRPPPHIDMQVHHDWDDNDEDIQHGGGFASGAPMRAVRGQRVHDLPHHVSIFFNNQNYFYDDDGNYYQQQGGDYVVVQPPVGAIVAALPPGIATIVAGPTTYYYLDGVFYIAQDNSFAVVNPPAGIVVPDLPSGASQVIVNGNVYYQFNGFDYQPSIQDGVTVYTVTPMS
jgi:hypothetical protein